MVQLLISCHHTSSEVALGEEEELGWEVLLVDGTWEGIWDELWATELISEGL